MTDYAHTASTARTPNTYHADEAPHQHYAHPSGRDPLTIGLVAAAFVLGIGAAILTIWSWLGIIPAVIGLVLALIARRRGIVGGIAGLSLWINVAALTFAIVFTLFFSATAVVAPAATAP